MTTSDQYYTRKTDKWLGMLFVWLTNCSDFHGGCDTCHRKEKCFKTYVEITDFWEKVKFPRLDRYNRLDEPKKEFKEEHDEEI